MRRFTTPTITLTVEGVDLTGMGVYVTIEQYGSEVTIDGGAVAYDAGEDATTITIDLTQAQTGALAPGPASVQVNWTDGSGHRDATTIGELAVEQNLLDEVIEDE